MIPDIHSISSMKETDFEKKDMIETFENKSNFSNFNFY